MKKNYHFIHSNGNSKFFSKITLPLLPPLQNLPSPCGRHRLSNRQPLFSPHSSLSLFLPLSLFSFPFSTSPLSLLSAPSPWPAVTHSPLRLATSLSPFSLPICLSFLPFPHHHRHHSQQLIAPANSHRRHQSPPVKGDSSSGLLAVVDSSTYSRHYYYYYYYYIIVHLNFLFFFFSTIAAAIVLHFSLAIRSTTDGYQTSPISHM